jgi:mono/diheme cytochrome c family protein
MKHWVSLVVVMVVTVLVLAACGADEDQPTSAEQPAAEAQAATGDATQGKQLFVATCSACHGPNGEGVQGLGKDMQHSEFIAGLTDAELVAFIKKGRPSSDPKNDTGIDMPPKGGNPALNDQQLLDIVAYIRSIHQ